MFLLLEKVYFNDLPFEKQTGQTDLSFNKTVRLDGEVEVGPCLVPELLDSSIINRDVGQVKHWEINLDYFNFIVRYMLYLNTT